MASYSENSHQELDFTLSKILEQLYRLSIDENIT